MLSTDQRPKITLKLATSLDGKIALSNGQSQWVTSEESRAHGRSLRAEHDAIAIGANTAVLDDPKLTTRIEGKPNPVRIVYDSRLRISPSSHLAETATETPTWVFTQNGMDQAKSKNLKDKGVSIHPIQHEKGLSLDDSLELMQSAGLQSILIEGGGTLIASFIKAGLFDIIHWYRAPVLLGGDGRDCVGALSLTEMTQAVMLKRVELTEMGPDLHEVYVKAAE